MKTTYFTETKSTVSVHTFFNKETHVIVNCIDNTLYINTPKTCIVTSGENIEIDAITEETLYITGLNNYKSIIVYANGEVSASGKED